MKEVIMYYKVDEVERRCLPMSEVELRVDGEDAPKITGYAAVFNTWADIGGWFRESIRPGAFAKTIKENDIRGLVNHDENFVLGRNKAKTLTLREDDKGLATTITPPGTTWANDLLVSMRRGDVNQMSFGFIVNKAEYDYDKDERVLTDVTLFDVSVVTFPAYPTTSAQVRSLFQNKGKMPSVTTTGTITVSSEAASTGWVNSDGTAVRTDWGLVPGGVIVPGGIVLPPPITEEWKELYRIADKIRDRQELTADELRTMLAFLPGLQEKPQDPPPAPAKVMDKFTELFYRAEKATA